VLDRFSQDYRIAHPVASVNTASSFQEPFSRHFDYQPIARQTRVRSSPCAHSDALKIVMLERNMTTIDSLTHLSDNELIARVKVLANDERLATVALIASLMEFDARRLYLGEGCSSLFTYCTQVLHLSEHAAYGRIEATRAARRFPMLLDLLAEGDLTLTAICLLAPHLTAENHHDVLAAARHKTKRDVELLVATLRPRPAVHAIVRKLPEAKPTTAKSVATVDLLASTFEPAKAVVERLSQTAIVAPLAPDRYKLQITLSAETYATLRRAQDLLRHSIPNGDPAAVVGRALTLLVRELERTKFAETHRPRKAQAGHTRSRHIPAHVRRRVWRRDGKQCAFVGTQGRCTERGFLEFHHVVPYADGGESTVENLELRCRAHNGYEADRWNGTLFARETIPRDFFGSVGDVEALLGPDRAGYYRDHFTQAVARCRQILVTSE
jgi:5-methylcytosine-specific restriction endonuclease McrA